MHKRLVRCGIRAETASGKGWHAPAPAARQWRHACNPAPGAVLTKSVSVAVCRVTDARLDGSRIIVWKKS